MSSNIEHAIESVWDYPRPPRIEPIEAEVVVRFGVTEIARTTGAFRVLETSHPPSVYLPRAAFAAGALVRAQARATICEWKGQATYWDIVAGDARAAAAAWSYEHPTPAFAQIGGCVSLYPGRMDQCTIAGETVTAQEGDFYGGWITANIRGPFKGVPGTRGW